MRATAAEVNKEHEGGCDCSICEHVGRFLEGGAYFAFDLCELRFLRGLTHTSGTQQ